jgi:molybdenum cofactor cytidylyltransferase
MSSVRGHSPLRESQPRLAAIILAAGYSSRMGQFKPLLRIGHGAVIEAVVRLFRGAGIPDVSVVLGHRANELCPVVEAAGARCVINSRFASGMYSSVCAGVAALPTGTDACFVIPADIPLVRVSTIRRLASFYAGKNKEIVYPVFQERRGHPPLISSRVLAEALGRGPEARLSTLLSEHENGAYNLFVPDEGIHLDMDTPDQLARIRELSCHREIPSPRECEALLAVYQAEELIARHSRAVADVAYRMAVALAEKGVSIDPLLARAGGLLHDLAKGKPHHAEAGAQLLRDFEFASVADVVAAHTDYTFEKQKLDEAAIVYLADKLVSGENVVGIVQRFHRSLERFRENPIALAAALRRRAMAEAIAQEIESCLGVRLTQVIADLPASGDGLRSA